MPSQNGLFAEWPQRQSEMTVRPARPKALPTGRTTRVWKRLRDDEHVYGLGEKTGELDKRGR